MSVASKKGDTLIEVVLAFAMFSLIAAISITIMNNGIASAEASLELTLARTEIDAQAETLRYIQSSFADDRAYQNLWTAITARALDASSRNKLPALSVDNCSDLYENYKGNPTIYDAKAFGVNARKVVDNPEEGNAEYYGQTLVTANNHTTDNVEFTTSSLNPRIIYTSNEIDTSDTDEELMETKVYDQIARVEGIYVVAVADSDHDKAYYYDFHIYTCWLPPGASRPTTIGTVTRLYNPEFINE